MAFDQPRGVHRVRAPNQRRAEVHLKRHVALSAESAETIHHHITEGFALFGRRLPPTLLQEAREDFARRYKEAVAEAFVSGIENAHRIGGQSAALEFLDDVRINFAGRPELLPPEAIDRAHQEIQK